MVALLISAATALLFTCESGSVAAASATSPHSRGADYEAKIQRALSHHAAKSRQLLARSLEAGGSAGGVAVGLDGTLSGGTGDGTNVSEELWETEFAIQALEEELKLLRMANGGNDDDNGSDDGENDYEDSSDDDYNGDSKDEKPSNLSSDDGDDDDDDDEYDDLSAEDRAVLKSIKDPRYRNIVYNNLLREADIRAEIAQHGFSWDELTYWELHAYFACHRIMAGVRPVYSVERWRRLRDLYNAFVAADSEEAPLAAGAPPRTYKFSAASFAAPTDPFGAEDAGGGPEEDEEKGRGLKAARDIAAGERVFRATNNTVVFNVGATWRTFLFEIYERRGARYDAETTCDFMVWSWIQRLEVDGPLVIVADMDNGSLLNEGRADDPEYDPPNVRCGQEGDTICLMSYYALQDIRKGEELLCDYKDFALIWSWKEMGL